MRDVFFNMFCIIISSCGVALAKYICSLINKKIDEAQVDTDIKNYEKLNQYIDSAQAVIANAVLTVTQTYVETLKKNGNFTKEAQLEAKEMAIDIANNLITEECKNAIITVYGDFETYLDSVIESLVQINK